MTDLMRQWVLSVACGAMIVTILQALLPKNGIGAVGRLASGLVLLLVTVQPLIRLDAEEMAAALTGYRLTQQGYAEELNEMNRDILEKIIEEETEAYILDKAESIGIACQVTVIYEWSEDGIPYPAQAQIVSDASAEEEKRLSRILEADLGIPPEAQVYKRTVG